MVKITFYKQQTRSPQPDDSNNIISIPHSLEDAILCFILTIAVRKIRGEQYPELVQMQKHNSMLIHISRFSKWQDKVKALIQNDAKDGYLDIVFRKLGTDNKGNGIYLDFERVWNYYYADIIGNLNGVMENHYFDPYIQKHDLSTVFNILPSIARDGIEVVSINSKSQDTLNYNTKQGRDYIAIGGNRLSRGFTLEGLSISYFTRTTGYADAILQMGRWFGYRPGYLDCCRLFVDRKSLDKFEECVKILDDLEKDIKAHMADTISNPRAIVNRIRATSGPFIKITRPNILRNGELAYFSFSDKLLQTHRFDLDKENHEQSWENFKDFFEKYDSQIENIDESSSYKLTIDDFEVVKELIGTSLLVNDSFDKERIFSFIDKQREEYGYLENWDIIFTNSPGSRGKVEVSLCNRKFRTVIRSGPKETITIGGKELPNKMFGRLLKDGIFAVGNANIIDPGDMSLALSVDVVNRIKSRKNDKKTIPESAYRKEYGKYKGVVLVYLIDSSMILKDNILENKWGMDTNIPIAGFAIGIPDLEVQPEIFYLKEREIAEVEGAEDNDEGAEG